MMEARSVWLAAQASWAVASSPPMCGYPRYVELVREAGARATRCNPPPARMLSEIVDVVHRGARAAREPLLVLPWADRRPDVGRTYAAYVSFVDDYRGPYPAELFPPSETSELIGAIARASERDEVLTIPEQLALALPLARGHVYAAVVVLHAATRALARDRDTRTRTAHAWDMCHCPWGNDTCDVEARVRMGGAVAGFEEEVARGGDPLGDTYHYWASFGAGMFTTLARGVVARRVMRAAFSVSPELMAVIRGGVFARPLFCGNHAQLDRLGLAQGTALARLLRR